MDLGLGGKSAIVCGASSGLGLAVAETLAAEGARVTMVARRGVLLAERAARIGANPVVGDLSDPQVAERVVEAAATWGGGLDIVVWNSGGPRPGRASDLTPEDLRDALDALYFPAVRLLRAAMPHLKASEAGRILAITASGVKEPLPSIALSNGIRPGLVGYLKSLAHDLGPEGITVNCVAPGRIGTERMRQLSPDGVRPEELELIPAGRLGQAEEVGALVAFLASARAAYITGTTVAVDGGLSRTIF